MENTIPQKIVKKVASRVAASKGGQKLIAHYLGDEGILLIKAVKHAVRKFTDASRANEFKSDLFKFVFKWAIMQERGQITISQATTLREPYMLMLIMVVGWFEGRRDAGACGRAREGGGDVVSARVSTILSQIQTVEVLLSQAKKSLSERVMGAANAGKVAGEILKVEDMFGSVQDVLRGIIGTEPMPNLLLASQLMPPPSIVQIAKQISVVADMVVKLMEPHMQDDNTRLLRTLFEFLGSEKFLTALLTDPEFHDERRELRHQMFALLHLPENEGQTWKPVSVKRRDSRVRQSILKETMRSDGREDSGAAAVVCGEAE
eukprot:91681_1